jgi:hypothetical protein
LRLDNPPVQYLFRDTQIRRNLAHRLLVHFSQSDALASIRCFVSTEWDEVQNSQGYIETTKGYKLHLDVSDTGFPITAVITGATIHNSHLAIPMEKQTEGKVQFFYSLMDSGYDADTITQYILSRDRIPIIDPNKRRDKERPPFDPAKKERYKIRNGRASEVVLTKMRYYRKRSM